MKTELKVLLYLKRNGQDKEGMCPLMGKISIKGETNSTAQFGCKIKVNPDLWNATSQRCTGKSKVAITTNREIENMLLRLRGRFDELCDTGNTVKADDVKTFSQAMASVQLTLLKIMGGHNEEYASRVGVNRHISSYKHYLRLYRLVSGFIKMKYKVSDIPVRQLDLDFMEAFDLYLRIEMRHKPNTRLGHFKCLKAIMNAAVRRGTLPYNPFKGYMAEKPEEKRRYLSMKEIKSIMSVQLDKPNRKFTRDMFIFSCFTGICYCDLCNLTKANLVKAEDGSLWVKTVRQKTGTPENVRLMDIAIQIINKYEGIAAEEKLFPMLAHGSITLHLKKIAALCGINRNITFHMARHCFASVVCLSLGVPIETVSKVMGHRNIITTQIYAKVTYEKIDKDVTDLHSHIDDKYSLQGVDLPPSQIMKDMSKRKTRKTWQMSPQKMEERRIQKEIERKKAI